MKLLIKLLIAGYLAYLGFATWQTGMLAVKVTKEVNKISCRPDCNLWKYRDKKPRKECEKYCKK